MSDITVIQADEETTVTIEESQNIDVTLETGIFLLKDHRLLTNRDANNQHPISAITELETKLGEKVPYTGATQDVDLGEFNLNAKDITSTSGNFDYVDLELEAIVSSQEGRISWNKDNSTLQIDTGTGVIINTGLDDYVIVYNDTDEQIDKGSVIHPVAVQTVDNRPDVQKAIANIHSRIDKDIFVSAIDIPSKSKGIAISRGYLSSIDTSLLNLTDTLYVSPFIVGEYVTTKPSFPNYTIQIGGVASVGVDGAIFIAIKGAVRDTLDDVFNGAIRETFDFRITSDGATITGSLTNPNVDNSSLTLLFSTGFYTFDCDTFGSIILTAGTTTSPQLNYVYIQESTKSLIINTTGFPDDIEHCKIAKVALLDASSTQTNGALRNQNTNDHIKTDEDNGHLLHIAERLREMNAEHDSGTESSLSGTPSNLYISTTAGKVWQIHKQVFPAFDMSTGDVVSVVNDFTSPYRTTTNLNDIDSYSDGSAWNNEWSNIVLWGVCNKTGEPSHIMINLPSDGYNSEENAVEDRNNFSNYTIPKAFKGVGFLIGRFTIRRSGTVFTYNPSVGYLDLRGFYPNNTAGGGTGGGGVSTFLGLTDTPSSYTSQAGKLVAVASGETALEFITPSSSNASYDVDGGIILSAGFQSSIPSLTSNTDQSYTISSSQITSGFEAWEAVNGLFTLTGNRWAANSISSYWQAQLPTSKAFQCYKIWGAFTANQTPTAWTIEASNTGTFAGEEVILDTVSGETGWAQYEERTFCFTNSTSYLYYRIVITAVDGGTLASMQEIQFSETDVKTLDITKLFPTLSSDRTQTLEVSAGSLDVTLNASWASGTAPTLTSASIFVWADYNSGTQRYILDDSTGSNIAGTKRMVNSLTTDSSGEIISFNGVEKAGGAVLNLFSEGAIQDIPVETVENTSYINYDLSVPNGIELEVKMQFLVRSNQGDATSPTIFVKDSKQKEIPAGYAVGSGDTNMSVDSYIVNDATIAFRAFSLGISTFNVRGYTSSYMNNRR